MCLNTCTYVYRQVPAGMHIHAHIVHVFLRSSGPPFRFELLAFFLPVLMGPEGICRGSLVVAVLCHPGWLETQSKLSWDWVRGVNLPLTEPW